jgi:hypothetical protein
MTNTPPLTDEQYAAIRAREAAATPGPWHVEDDKRDLNRWVVSEAGTLEANFGYVGNGNQDDSAFVAAAREDVPALLGEVDRLRKVNAAWSAESDLLLGIIREANQILREPSDAADRLEAIRELLNP